jgi:hypothetical protein
MANAYKVKKFIMVNMKEGQEEEVKSGEDEDKDPNKEAMSVPLSPLHMSSVLGELPRRPGRIAKPTMYYIEKAERLREENQSVLDSKEKRREKSHALYDRIRAHQQQNHRTAV